jgi:hypothetical protein
VASLSLVIWPANAAGADTGTLYLKGNGVPKADLSTTAPISDSLPNYDPNRDSDPGLMLQKSADGWAENDSKKYQMWVSSSEGMEINGQVTLNFWSAMKDFEDDKVGLVEAFLLDCSPGGGGCVLIDQASRESDPWNPSETWVSKTIDFGVVTYSIAADRSLALKLVVGDDSDDDMWFAYDTTSYPSSLSVQLAAPVTTTTTSTTLAPTTTTAPATTTTTRPPAVTTTISSSPTVAPVGPGTTTTTTTLIAVESPGRGSGPPADGGPASEDGLTPQSHAPESGLPEFGGAGDPALAAMGVRDEASTEPSTRASAWTGSIIEGLELVIPPWAAEMMASPLMVLGFVVEAMTDSGRAIMLPLALLMAGMLWVIFENRVFSLALIRRPENEKAGS